MSGSYNNKNYQYRKSHQSRPQSPRPNRPYPYRRKRQASGNEVVLTLIVIAIFGISAAASQLSSDAVPVLIAGLILVAAVVMGIMIWVSWNNHRKTRAIQLSGVDVMDGFVFEKYVVQLLKKQGYTHVRLTEKYDLGIDVIAHKDGEIWGIQVKRNRGKCKAISVRQAVTALTHYNCTRAMVITNSTFTGAAKQLAASNNAVLIDRPQLARWIVDLQHQ